MLSQTRKQHQEQQHATTPPFPPAIHSFLLRHFLSSTAFLGISGLVAVFFCFAAAGPGGVAGRSVHEGIGHITLIKF